ISFWSSRLAQPTIALHLSMTALGLATFLKSAKYTHRTFTFRTDDAKLRTSYVGLSASLPTSRNNTSESITDSSTHTTSAPMPFKATGGQPHSPHFVYWR